MVIAVGVSGKGVVLVLIEGLIGGIEITPPVVVVTGRVVVSVGPTNTVGCIGVSRVAFVTSGEATGGATKVVLEVVVVVAGAGGITIFTLDSGGLSS